jgi:hypothetical protein
MRLVAGRFALLAKTSVTVRGQDASVAMNNF